MIGLHDFEFQCSQEAGRSTASDDRNGSGLYQEPGGDRAWGSRVGLLKSAVTVGMGRTIGAFRSAAVPMTGTDSTSSPATEQTMQEGSG